MPRQIEYRSTSRFPADEVYAAMTDREYLEARLASMGGPGAALLEHHVDPAGVRYQLRHGLDARDLPSMVRNLVPGDIVIERLETWRQQDAGRYAGEAQVEIPGTPASAAGGGRLRDVGEAAGGSELIVRMEITVSIPFLGGKIEDVICDQVLNLLAAEAGFTQQWLDKQR